MAVAGMFAMVSCGPSADEKAAAEKATQDSIANAEAEMKAAEEAANAPVAEEAAPEVVAEATEAPAADAEGTEEAQA